MISEPMKASSQSIPQSRPTVPQRNKRLRSASRNPRNFKPISRSLAAVPCPRYRQAARADDTIEHPVGDAVYQRLVMGEPSGLREGGADAGLLPLRDRV